VFCRIDCQADLSKGLTNINENSKLFVLREAPQTLLPKLWKQWKITHIVCEKDTDAYGRERDDKVMKMAEEAGVVFIIVQGRTLWDSDELVRANGGKPTMSISQVQAVSTVYCCRYKGDILIPFVGREKARQYSKAFTSAQKYT
jgi:cryptochrome